MSSDYGPYHSPENYGLEIIGSIDWAGDYEYDMVVVWRRLEDGMFLWAQDSGCSCPTPFDTHRVSDGIADGVEPIENLAAFHAMLLSKNGGAMTTGHQGDQAMGITDLVTRLHGLGLR